ncbi:MAG: hypothetical protein JWO25_2090 [Alphaproteobacteria bacterium]|nr:hypothetical protein [Alphaproteobacteria bacterium]
MNRLKALQNPFLLVAEGFLAGAILFMSTSPGVSHDLLHRAQHMHMHAGSATPRR